MYLSVVVVSYNSRHFLPACLDSILGQLDPTSELIVVDNGSADGSADLVQQEYPQVRLLRGANVGYSGGNNRGAHDAKGEYLVFLNPDTVLQPGALAALIAPLTRHDDVALTTACIVFRDRPDTVNTCGNTTHYSGLTYCRGAERPRSQYRHSVEVDAVSGAAFAIRRAVFEELKGFDEQFFMYVEDTDLSWRARLAGYRCLYVPEAVVEHAYRMSYSPTKAFYVDRNRHIMLLKNLRLQTYVRMLPGLCLAELVTCGFLLIKGPHYWSIKPRIYRWLWRNRRAIRKTSRSARVAWSEHDRALVGSLTHRLEFNQLANAYLARVAAIVFHPTFWLARMLVVIPPSRRATSR